MFDILRTHPRRTIIVLGAVAMLAVIYLLLVMEHTRSQNDGNIGAVLDDTWIHVRFAWHIGQGEGLTYNEGVLTAGATSPFWVLLLAIPMAIFEPDTFEQIDIAIYLSAAWYIMTVVIIAAFGWWVSRRAWIGFAAGVLTVLTGRLIWMGLSGMETTAFTALCIIAIWSHMQDMRVQRPFSWRTGILLALATLARPEAYLLTILAGLEAFFFIPWRDNRTIRSIIDAFRNGWRGIVAYLLLAGSYPIVNLMIDGYPLPNTFRAKSYLGREYPELPRAFFWMANRDHGILFIALASIAVMVVTWRAFKRNQPGALYVLWPPIFILAVLFLGSERYYINHSRYIAPSIPLIALAAVLGIYWLYQQVSHRTSARVAATLVVMPLLSIIAGMTFTRGFYNGEQVANDVYQLRAMHVEAGYWFRERTQPDESIALNDVGAIVHVSEREVLDLEGLVSPDVLDATNDEVEKTCAHDLQLARQIMQNNIRFIAVFPWFYPCLVGWDGALQPETVFAITGQTVLAGGEMVVYYPVWENWPVQRAVVPEAEPLNIELEEGIVLAAFEMDVTGEQLALTLWWEATEQPAGDYHVFVHLIDVNGHIITLEDGRTLQSDSVPQRRNASAFNTSWWRPGDIIPDQHIISLTGLTELTDASLNIGMYRFPNFARLQRQDGNGDTINIPLESRTITANVSQ